jgi:redox-sensitive bicupin YhaK (pirin superfamily)
MPQLDPGAVLPLPDDHEDRGVYVISGRDDRGRRRFEAGRMMVFRPGDAITLKAGERARGSWCWAARR